MENFPVFPDLREDAREKVRAALEAPHRGLFSDLDGTLSAIVSSPAAAVVRSEVRDLLAEARTSFDLVAVVSGRPALEAARLIQVPGIVYAGNHGLERVQLTPENSHGRGSVPRQIHPEAARYERVIDETLVNIKMTLGRRFPGVWIEPKGVTGSIHLRAVAEPEAAEEAVYELAQRLGGPRGLRVTRGRRVIELRPPVEANKGTAVTDLIRERELSGALYIGDDQTDLDAFHALRELGRTSGVHGVAVAVLSAEVPDELADAADIRLSGEEQVPQFLRWLLDGARGDGRGDGDVAAVANAGEREGTDMGTGTGRGARRGTSATTAH